MRALRELEAQVEEAKSKALALQAELSSAQSAAAQQLTAVSAQRSELATQAANAEGQVRTVCWNMLLAFAALRTPGCFNTFASPL